MSEIKDGGPAFPVKDGSPLAKGMTLRDYFAAQALVGVLASLNPGSLNEQDAKHTAEQAGRLADAMIRERDR